MIKIDREGARKYLLKYQNLYNPRELDSDDEIVNFIRKVGCIQFDPLNKVSRNADLVLQSRCKGYSEKTLYRLLYEKRELIDGWDKNMSIWSMEDWPYFARKRDYYKKRYMSRANEFEMLRNKTVARLKKCEYISSNDFDEKKKVDWSWAPTKIGRAILESMYHCGELAIHHKDGTRKYYGSSRNLIHKSILKKADPNGTLNDFNDWYVKRRIGGIGLLWNRSGDGWLGTSLKKEERALSITRLMEKGLIAEVEIAGVDDIFYMPGNELKLLQDNSIYHEASVVAPLDNLMWDRKLISRLFNFEYKWEVYTPVKERKYGYYVLPVVYGDKFIGRFEPLINRRKNELFIKNWWWEKNIKRTQEMEAALTRCLDAFCRYLQVGKISISKSLPQKSMGFINYCV